MAMIGSSTYYLLRMCLAYNEAIHRLPFSVLFMNCFFVSVSYLFEEQIRGRVWNEVEIETLKNNFELAMKAMPSQVQVQNRDGDTIFSNAVYEYELGKVDYT